MSRFEELKRNLVETLNELDKLGTVVFEDTDCDCYSTYNLRDVIFDANTNEVVIKLAMYSDSLPAHEHNPRKTSKGGNIPYVLMEGLAE